MTHPERRMRCTEASLFLVHPRKSTRPRCTYSNPHRDLPFRSAEMRTHRRTRRGATLTPSSRFSSPTSATSFDVRLGAGNSQRTPQLACLPLRPPLDPPSSPQLLLYLGRPSPLNPSNPTSKCGAASPFQPAELLPAFPGIWGAKETSAPPSPTRSTPRDL